MSKVGEPLEFSYKPPPDDVLTIEGVDYSGELFRAWAKDGVPLNQPFVITEHHGQYFTIENCHTVKRPPGGRPISEGSWVKKRASRPLEVKCVNEGGLAGPAWLHTVIGVVLGLAILFFIYGWAVGR